MEGTQYNFSEVDKYLVLCNRTDFDYTEFVKEYEILLAIKFKSNNLVYCIQKNYKTIALIHLKDIFTLITKLYSHARYEMIFDYVILNDAVVITKECINLKFSLFNIFSEKLNIQLNRSTKYLNGKLEEFDKSNQTEGV